MSDTQAEAAIFERPTGWRRTYYHPVVQVALLGFVCFMCPGMFNALTGLGGGGEVNTINQANATAALYAVFAFFGFFSGQVRHCMCSLRSMEINDSRKVDQQSPWAPTYAHAGDMGILFIHCFLFVWPPFQVSFNAVSLSFSLEL